jgi:MoaA/NifB/PqqE/SkfB family radical SAM enzyme
MSKPICLAPFIGVNVSGFGIMPCCHIPAFEQPGDLESYLSHPELLKLQEQHLNKAVADLPRGCQLCINSDNNSSFSEFKYGANENYTKLYEEKGRAVGQLVIANSFECGYNCVMCFSSDKKYKVLDEVGHEHLPVATDKPDGHIEANFDLIRTVTEHLDDLQFVSFAGGDPAMNSDVPEVLRILAKRPDIRIIYHHNGHRNKLRDRSSLWELLKPFTDLSVIFSTDGSPRLNESFRVGYKHDRFMKCFNECREELPNARIEALVAITSVTVMRIRETCDWLESNMVPYGVYILHTPVDHPAWYGTGNIPYRLKSTVLKEIRAMLDEDYSKSIKELLVDLAKTLKNYNFDQTMWQALMKDREKMDNYYGTSTLAINPEFKPYWLV